MARHERNNVDYFPHEVNHGRKMFIIKQKHGNDGYAIWFQLLEELGKAEFHYLNLTDETQFLYLTSQFLTTETKLNEVLSDLARLNAINRELWEKHKIVFSEKFVENVGDAYKNRKNKPITLSSLYDKLFYKTDGNGITSSGKPQTILKERKEEKKKENSVETHGSGKKPDSRPSEEEGGLPENYKVLKEQAFNGTD